MKPRIVVLLTLSFAARLCLAQFAPAAGQPGSTALRADSSCFVNWAQRCTIQRGLKQINLADSGFASVGEAAAAVGPAASNGVVSLGDGGTATLYFNPPITNGKGFDFAVFENTFLDTFLELAFVEVSTDSLSWARFPSKSLTQTVYQTGAFGFTKPTHIHNLAGKYRHPFGTPFDLEDLAMMSNIQINQIYYVRLRDVVGSIDTTLGSKDSEGRMINDPWPTTFGSSGFDLDAVGVINQQPGMSTVAMQSNNMLWYNEANNTVCTRNPIPHVTTVYNAQGQVVKQQKIDLLEPMSLDLPAGIYTVKLQHHSIKIIITSTR